MKSLILVICFFVATCFCKAQEVSYLYKQPENIQFNQNNVIRYADNKLFVLQSTYEVDSNSYPNFIPYLDQYTLLGNVMDIRRDWLTQRTQRAQSDRDLFVIFSVFSVTSV